MNGDDLAKVQTGMIMTKWLAYNQETYGQWGMYGVLPSYTSKIKDRTCLLLMNGRELKISFPT